MIRWLIETIALLLIGVVFFVFMVGMMGGGPDYQYGDVSDVNVPAEPNTQVQADIDEIEWEIQAQKSMLEQSVHMAKEK